MRRARERREAKAASAVASAVLDEETTHQHAESSASARGEVSEAAAGADKPFAAQLRQYLVDAYGPKAGLSLTVAFMSQLADTVQQLSPSDAEAILAGLDREEEALAAASLTSAAT